MGSETETNKEADMSDIAEIKVAVKTFTESMLFKFGLAGALTIALLIPAGMLRSLVSERMDRRNGAIKEMDSKWGGPQTVAGPVMLIPQTKYVEKRGDRVFANFLPERLYAETEIKPEPRRRGIYETVVYRAEIRMKGAFAAPDLRKLALAPDEADSKGALLCLGVSDVAGFAEKVSFTVNGRSLEVLPGTAGAGFMGAGLHVRCPEELLKSGFEFNVEMTLNGSGDLNFVPAGKESVIAMKSAWADPSFSGARLPVERRVDADGFSATWRTIDLNRGHNHEWIGCAEDAKFMASARGVKLLVTADMYQQTERSVKYAALFIALTFMSLIFAERLCGVKAHPLQYLLIGLALVVFYSLLLSLSEQLGFGKAYLVSASAVVCLIALYAKSVFRSLKPSLSIAAISASLYAYLYTLLQMEDYSLLFGSLGLFATLAALMFLTRRLNRDARQGSPSMETAAA